MVRTLPLLRRRRQQYQALRPKKRRVGPALVALPWRADKRQPYKNNFMSISKQGRFESEPDQFSGRESLELTRIENSRFSRAPNNGELLDGNAPKLLL